ncbi:hypothetical protein TSUD_08650 [Trifolium subterraneum]|nr:hypothetical protein TSUD_08650 [Trifolium subterraneum]
MASNNNTNDRMNPESEEIQALENIIEKQELRLSQLLSSGFQLANYYFVFQGVILTVLCNRETVLKCSDRWFLAALSALAAAKMRNNHKELKMGTHHHHQEFQMRIHHRQEVKI